MSHYLWQRADCISCPSTPPTCSCSTSESCVRINRDCNVCDSVKCIPIQSSSGSGGGGVTKATLAGSVSAVVVLAIVASALFFWWKRRLQSALQQPAEPPAKPVPHDVPASAESVLSRPDPIEKPPSSPSIHNSLPPTPFSDGGSVRSGRESNRLLGDPFADQATIQTASARTHSPNVITIGLMPPPEGLDTRPPLPTGPVRPARSPEISLRSETPYESSVNLAHANVSDNSLRPPNARFARRQSQLSAISALSGTSGFSNASSTFDILHEAPTIVTPNHQGAVRQVLGVAKAEVLHAPPSTPAGSPSLRATRTASTRTAKSPLSKAPYTLDDISELNPFSDRHSTASSVSSPRTDHSQGTLTPGQTPTTPHHWFPPSISRPISVASNAGTIVADIANATRVVLGMQSPQYSTVATAHTSLSSSRSVASSHPHTPPPTALTGQQMDPRRVSQSSVVSATSSRADSILEAFPFVPPSPIAARPPRSPLGSPLGSAFGGPPSPARSTHAPTHMSTAVQPPTPHTPGSSDEATTPSSEAPSRRTLGLSTVSQMSTSSGLSGLDSFTFKFSDGDMPPMPRNSSRASLDTLALSRDVEAFPLPYDDPLRDSVVPSPAKDPLRDSIAPSTK